LAASDQRQVTASADEIERELKFDADLKGECVKDQLRKLEAGPLVYYYLASPLDRLATVWSRADFDAPKGRLLSRRPARKLPRRRRSAQTSERRTGA